MSRSWKLLLEAVGQTAPIVFETLRLEPFRAFKKLAADYEALDSEYKFGPTIQVMRGPDGKPSIDLFPFSDLAKIVRSTEYMPSENTWPAASLFWDKSLRTSALELTLSMRHWAANFTDQEGSPHFMIINAALNTMGTWHMNKDTISKNIWYGVIEMIPKKSYPRVEAKYTIQGWDPLNENEDEFLKRIKDAISHLSKWSREHLKDTKAKIVNFDSKRNKNHYHWAALRLGMGLSYSEISQEWANRQPSSPDEKDETTFRKAVQGVLKDLGLRDLQLRRK